MFDTNSTVTAAEAVITAYKREASNIESEHLRIDRLRALVEATTHVDMNLMCTDARGRIEVMRSYGERSLLLSADGTPTIKRDCDLTGNDRASAIAGPPIKALLLMWVAEQERALAKHKAAFDARDIQAEISAAMSAAKETV